MCVVWPAGGCSTLAPNVKTGVESDAERESFWTGPLTQDPGGPPGAPLGLAIAYNSYPLPAEFRGYLLLPPPPPPD